MSGLAIHDTGDGPALLLLHAYPLDASQWDGQVAALSDRYRCLRPDMWGCAGSPPAAAGLSIESYARDVLAALDGRDVSDFAVCGSSMGGYTAFALLRLAPRRVRAVVLAGTRAGADSEAVLASRAQVMDEVRAHGVEAIVEPMTESLLCRRSRDDAHIADPVRGRIRRWTTEGVLSVQGALGGRPDSAATLAAIGVPTLVVHGSDDAIVGVEESRAMAAAIPGAEVAEFEACGHLPNLELPHDFSVCAGRFLDGDAVRRSWSIVSQGGGRG